MLNKKVVKMNRILVFGMTENPGGVESFLVNYYRNIDRDKIQFDFLCNSHQLVAYEDELIKLGGRTFHITARSKDRNNYKKELKAVFENHASEWSAIWVNVCSLANIDYLKMAKRYGIKKRIIHSHNSQNMDSKLRVLLHRWNKRYIRKYATDFWACSEDAAHWFYSDELMKETVIIHNAIDVERMKFDEKKRKNIRKQYKLENKYVIGNVGRLHFQKNQEFAIEVFNEYHKGNPDSVLVLVGQGEDEEKLKVKVKEYRLADSVIFTGVQKDIQGWLSSFDIFLFPSLFEGLSVVALEAQANGIPILASRGVVPEEVKMSNNLVFFDLLEGNKAWADKIVMMREFKRLDYYSINQSFISTGYDIKTEVRKLERLLVD